MLASLIKAPEPGLLSNEYFGHQALKIASDASLISLIAGVALLIFGAITFNPIVMGIAGAMISANSIVLGVCLGILARKKADHDAKENETKSQITSLFNQGIQVANTAFDNLILGLKELAKSIRENLLTPEELAARKTEVEELKQTVKNEIMDPIEDRYNTLLEKNLLSVDMREAFTRLKLRAINAGI